MDVQHKLDEGFNDPKGSTHSSLLFYKILPKVIIETLKFVLCKYPVEGLMEGTCCKINEKDEITCRNLNF